MNILPTSLNILSIILIFYLIRRGGVQEDLSSEVCLELGTGWYPIVPIGLFLKGAKKIHSVDISPLLSTPTFIHCVKEIVKREKQFIKHLGEGITTRFEVLRKIANSYDDNAKLEELCSLVNLELHVTDARKLPFSDSSISFITSNNTFEHIYPDILQDILIEFWRILSPQGAMSHFIDMSDHFAHMDASITIYNFLQYTEQAWALIDNSVQPQNRWRFKRYKQLYRQLDIPFIEAKVRPGNIEHLKQLNISKHLTAYSLSELAISHGYLISVKP